MALLGRRQAPGSYTGLVPQPAPATGGAARPEPAGGSWADQQAATGDQVSCARCDVMAEGAAPLAWSCTREGGGARYLCGPCTRTVLRSLEARLDPSWW